MRRALALLPAFALVACVAAPIDRADRAAEARIEQAAQEVRKVAQDAAESIDNLRAAAAADVDARLERRVADLDARAAARFADADARISARLSEVREGLDAARGESAEWRAVATRAIDESAKWRDEVSAWRAEAASLRSAFMGDMAVPSPQPAGPQPISPALPDEDKYAMWFAVAGAAFTLAKTGRRIWLDRKARGAS